MLCMGDRYDGDSGETASLSTADAIAVSNPDQANSMAADGVRSAASSICSSRDVNTALSFAGASSAASNCSSWASCLSYRNQSPGPCT